MEMEMFTCKPGLDFLGSWAYNNIKVAEKTGDQDVSPRNRVKRSFQSKLDPGETQVPFTF